SLVAQKYGHSLEPNQVHAFTGAGEEAGVEGLNQPFYPAGNIATAGGCLASQYLAAWIIARTEGEEAARSALHYVAPVGEKEEYVARAMKNVAPYLSNPRA